MSHFGDPVLKNTSYVRYYGWCGMKNHFKMAKIKKKS
jgi:hypothetical protein